MDSQTLTRHCTLNRPSVAKALLFLVGILRVRPGLSSCDGIYQRELTRVRRRDPASGAPVDHRQRIQALPGKYRLTTPARTRRNWKSPPPKHGKSIGSMRYCWDRLTGGRFHGEQQASTPRQRVSSLARHPANYDTTSNPIANRSAWTGIPQRERRSAKEQFTEVVKPGFAGQGS